MMVRVEERTEVLDYDLGQIPRKFRISRRPASWLFSGWNWQAKRLPRSTAPANLWVPWVVAATTVDGSDGSGKYEWM